MNKIGYRMMAPLLPGFAAFRDARPADRIPADAGWFSGIAGRLDRDRQHEG